MDPDDRLRAHASRGADLLQLDVASAPQRGVGEWLAAQLRSAVLDGRLAPGALLPASRSLAGDLGLSRGVVTAAYARLVDEGLLEGRAGAGTRVAPGTTGPVPRGPSSSSSPRAVTTAAFLLPGARGDSPVPVDVDLWPGVPDLSAFPRAAWLRAERHVLATASARDLGYPDPRGHPVLREQLVAWLARTRGVRVHPDDLLVVSGVAQALALLAQVLRSRGEDRVAVEDPGSRGARDELAHWGMRPVPVGVDDEGLDVSALVRLTADHGLAAPRTVVVTPAHQYPTGTVLSPERRRALLAWARQDRLVVEDDYDAEHRYDRPPVAALQASAPDVVAHTGSTSKTLAPALRLGWLVAPAHLRAQLVEAKHASDIASPGIPQLVLAHLLRTGALDRHLRSVRTRQRTRRDALLAGLREHLPGALVHGVAAGLHLLVTLEGTRWASEPDTDAAAACARAGVRVQPLSTHRIAAGAPGLVLGYATEPPGALAEGARRLGAVLR